MQPLFLQDPVVKNIMVNPLDFHLLPAFSFEFHSTLRHDAAGSFVPGVVGRLHPVQTQLGEGQIEDER